MNYSLPRGYQPRLEPDYLDNGYEGVWQPDVCRFGLTRLAYLSDWM